MYTLEDYEKAKAELTCWREAWDNYTGNNPDKYQTDIRNAARRMREIEQCLKNAGLLEWTEREKLEGELDRMFQNAQSKEIVEYRGKKYLRRYWAARKKPVWKNRERMGAKVGNWSRNDC